MNEYTSKAKAIKKLERVGMQTRLRLASRLEAKGVTVTERGVPSSEELADAMAEVIRRTQQGTSPASSKKAQEILTELQTMDLPEADEDQDEVDEILADLDDMQIPVAE